MSTHKHFDRICAVVLALTLLGTVLFLNGSALGIQSAGSTLGYENRLFDTSRVHTLDIAIDDWDAFLSDCEDEEYTACSVVVDGEAYRNVGLRAKGNSSLSTVRSMDSQRYSLKIEFDRYESGKSYHGLDKLCLNNIIQDNTYLKDYLTYRLMDEYGVDAPLCSYVNITVNGEPWGLFLAVEGIEDSFLQRNYGRNIGDLYKPDSQSFGGGGPGHGRNFNIEDFRREDTDNTEETASSSDTVNAGGMNGGGRRMGRGNGGFQPPGMGGGFPVPGMDNSSDSFQSPGMDASSDTFAGGFQSPGMDRSSDGFVGGFPFPGTDASSDTFAFPFPGMGGMPGGGRDNSSPFDFGGMGGNDVKLQYSGDDPDSYSSIFGNAKTDVTEADKARLIAALKQLGEREDLEDVLDMDKVLRYFVVHNYVVNGDSYTGSMVHNYYLYEKDGQLSMIPWDYNLAFGGFQGGSASASVNDPIDTPLSVSGDGTRPMADWFAQGDEYTKLYHQYFADFLDTVDIEAILDEAYAVIAPYVAEDSTAFCTYEEFEAGAAALRTFCQLRTASVRGQLDGTIPSTDAGQDADSSTLIDTGTLDLSDMGNMGRGGGFGGRNNWNNRNGGNAESAGNGENAENAGNNESTGSESPERAADTESGGMPDSAPVGGFSGGFPGSSDGFDGTLPGFPGGNFPGGGDGGFPGGEFPGGGDFPGFGGTDSGASSLTPETWALLGISVLILAVGTLLARKWKWA